MPEKYRGGVAAGRREPALDPRMKIEIEVTALRPAAA
jgi:hypothetical protein